MNRIRLRIRMKLRIHIKQKIQTPLPMKRIILKMIPMEVAVREIHPGRVVKTGRMAIKMIRVYGSRLNSLLRMSAWVK
ncbi:hypothetical protein CHM34_17955 [Paludifilum halophilum]|uniref:Uncharacterized protein n=1 Tax=Paludifilum halophilum TaxID=1642702 RepID=A0A235B2F7_9BACL|nr:hypothetical protein CHM34_17955 [Paludifilum halophilum]